MEDPPRDVGLTGRGRSPDTPGSERDRPKPTPERLPLLPAAGLALWFAAMTAAVQVAILAYRSLGIGEIVGLTRDFIWMTPLAYIPFFLLIAAALWIGGRAIPPLGHPRAHAFGHALFGFLCVGVLFPQLSLWARAILAAGIAYQLSKWLVGRPGRRRGVFAVTGTTVVLVLLVGGWWFRAGHYRSERADAPASLALPESAPNVLLIILDTVRARSLSGYGNPRETTPNLDRLASEGALFEAAYSTAPWTLPSHGSLFTGRLPHGLSTGYRTPLDDEHPVIAELLRAAGYRTGAFVANLHYATGETGILRGFDRRVDHKVTIRQLLFNANILQTQFARRIVWSLQDRDLRQLLDALVRFEFANDERLPHYDRKWAPRVNAEFLGWLDAEVGPERPFFAFLNYFDAHYPYRPPPEFDTYDSAGVTRPLDLYEGSLRYLDHHLGRLFDELDSRGLLNETLVVVTSDHGEHFGEHRLWRHGEGVYAPVTWVPMLARLPGSVPAGRRVETPVSIADLPATISDLVGLSSAPFPGVSARSLWSGPGERPPESPVVLEDVAGSAGDWSGTHGVRGLVTDTLHYIRFPDAREVLYHRLEDTLQIRDLVRTRAGAVRAASLRELLGAVSPFDPAAPRVPIVEEERRPETDAVQETGRGG